VVDDKAENRYLLELMLRGAGYTVLTSENGIQALKVLNSQEVDLIISDILMPEMDGFRLCREVKSIEKFKAIPFVFYTATYTEPKDEQLARSIGASRFIIKPTEPERFLASIKEVVDLGKAQSLPVPQRPIAPEFPSAYSERVVHKLERKVTQLEATSRELRNAIDEKNREVRERQNAERALSETLRYKDQFLALLGHELRNPLAPICNAAYALRQKVSPNDLKLVCLIERQVHHLTRLVNDLLDVSSIMLGKMVHHKEAVDLSTLLKQILEDQRAGFDAVSVHLEQSLPSHSVWVSGDAVRLSQVIRNLLDNALKFTPRSGTVHVALTIENGQARISVRDSGIGIDPELMSHLFKPFLHLQPRHEPGKGGLGLGLALVKGLVDLQGGTLRAESGGFGKGALFIVEFPVLPAPTGTEKAPIMPACETFPRRILIIEDNEDAAMTLRLLFETMGHEVRTAEDGCTGLETARGFHPDAIFCDIGLPGGMDGYAVARSMRADPLLKNTFLVAITGFGEAKDQQLAREAGFNLHITKPGDPKAMTDLLNEIPVLHSHSVS
jgi:signal transduction histidine kinase